MSDIEFSVALTGDPQAVRISASRPGSSEVVINIFESHLPHRSIVVSIDGDFTHAIDPDDELRVYVNDRTIPAFEQVRSAGGLNHG